MIEIEEDYSQLDRLGRGLHAYQEATGKTLGFVMITKGKDLAHELAKATKRITPSEAKIMALGGNSFPKKVYPGRKQIRTTGWAIKRNIGVRAIDELHRRVKTRFYSARGWSPAIQGFSGGLGTARTVVKKIGALIARVDDKSGEASLTLVNRTKVIEEQSRKHGIVTRAIQKVMADMSDYLGRSLGQEAKNAFDRI